MNFNLLVSRIPARFWGYFALCLWGGISLLFLLRQDFFGLSEGAAKALLLTWSISDQVASPVVTFSTPDFRVLLYLPIGYLWTGSAFAAKTLTLGLLSLAVWLLFSWKQRNADSESALLASGLLLISPFALEQVDSLSPGIYLLLAFALGDRLDRAYRSDPKAFGGWYFAQLFVCAFSTSLHPAGLAYPLALLWTWRASPAEPKHQKYFYIGISLMTLFTLILRMGWNDLSWLQNPITNLGALLAGTPLDQDFSSAHWIGGVIILALLAIVIWKQFQNLRSDLTGRVLLLALPLGAVVGDQAWGLMVLCVVLYFGFPLLLRPGQARSGGFFRQRGPVLLLLFVTSTFFMRGDRGHYELHKDNILSAQDQLIRTLAEEVDSARAANESNEGELSQPRFVVSSQWPSRTMIACKCTTWPLPPAESNPETQFAKLHGITHLLLDPKQTSNIELERNLSLLGGVIETTSLQPGGVLLHVKEEETAPKGNPS